LPPSPRIGEVDPSFWPQPSYLLRVTLNMETKLPLAPTSRKEGAFGLRSERARATIRRFRARQYCKWPVVGVGWPWPIGAPCRCSFVPGQSPGHVPSPHTTTSTAHLIFPTSGKTAERFLYFPKPAVSVQHPASNIHHGFFVTFGISNVSGIFLESSEFPSQRGAQARGRCELW